LTDNRAAERSAAVGSDVSTERNERTGNAAISTALNLHYQHHHHHHHHQQQQQQQASFCDNISNASVSSSLSLSLSLLTIFAFPQNVFIATGTCLRF